MALTRVDQPTPPVAAMAEPSLAVVGQGVKRTVLNGRPYDYRAGQYVVVSVDLPVTGQALEASPEEPFVVFSMGLRPTAIAPLLLEAVEAGHGVVRPGHGVARPGHGVARPPPSTGSR
ncbi:AraC family transcriptional regulator [Streptomyces sp. M19]